MIYGLIQYRGTWKWSKSTNVYVSMKFNTKDDGSDHSYHQGSFKQGWRTYVLLVILVTSTQHNTGVQANLSTC